MSSATSTNPMDHPINQQPSNITIGSNHGSNTQIVIENNSDDITISKCEQIPVSQETLGSIPAIPLKAQVLPLVYFPNNPKISFPGINTPSPNNIILSSITTNPSFLNKTPQSTTTASIPIQPLNQNVMFTSGRGQPLVLPKPLPTIMPARTYVTMIKQVPKPLESRHLETFVSSTTPETIIVSQNGFIQTGNQPQKFVLAPMPKLTLNRPPVTATTNSVQPKITVLPMPVPQNDTGPLQTQKVYNFQISDGKLQYSNFSSPVTIMCDNKALEKKKNKMTDFISVTSKNSLLCKEKFESECSEKNDITNKTYELSIAEESLSNQSDARLVVSSVDSNSSNENQPVKVEPKQPLKFSHGVSILKKNLSGSTYQERKFESVTVNTINLSLDNDLTIIKPSNGMEEKIIVTVPSITAPKPDRERRRKSQFCFRKDFDEMDISFPDSEPMIKKEEIKKEDEVKEEVVVKDECKSEKMDTTQEEKQAVPDPKCIFSTNNNNFDAQKLLTWEGGIGTLPGSSLKFILNEFNIIEYLPDEDYNKMINKKQKKARLKVNQDKEVRCMDCGCYGLRSDFINSDFCSIDCQEASSSSVKKEIDSTQVKKSKRRLVKSKSDNDIKDGNENPSDEDNSNDTSQDKFTYPWACKKKGFSWSKYLAHVNAKAAPVKLFRDPFPYTRNGFKAGMKLEGVDPQHPPYFCVLTVTEVVGYRIRLHFDGYADNYDFWCNADSMDIFPMGWCEKYGHVLHPPSGYSEENFNWLQYLKVTKSTAAPKHLFANRAGQAICPNGFRIGMKLEAVDKKNYALICVATVRDMMDNRILVHFDAWDDIYDYWADPTSPYIHPVGWCDQYGHNLTPPSTYRTAENFTWENYLKETKSVAAPVRAFKQRSACGFKRGMRLECVDKRVPQLIRVATVDDVKEHQIRIHFDGWPDRYSYWVDDDNPDIHPVGWCQKTGHPMEPPLTPDDVYDFLECPTVGCRGQGHTEGLKYSTHSTQKYCPYADANIDVERVLPDRLLSPDRSPEAIVPVSREPKNYKHKSKLRKPLKRPKELEPIKSEIKDEPTEKKQKKIDYPKKKHSEEHKESSLENKAQKLINESKINPAEKESWTKHSEFLNEFINLDENPQSWTRSDVMDFVDSIPGCENYSHAFKHKNIDGESFLHLNQKDLLDILSFKVGPAVKLYNSIVLLREQFCNK